MPYKLDIYKIIQYWLPVANQQCDTKYGPRKKMNPVIMEVQGFYWGGRPGSNRRPLEPQSSALTY